MEDNRTDVEKLLAETEAIVNGIAESEEFKVEQGFEEFVRDLMSGFNIPRRQAIMVAKQVRANYRANARRQGISVQEYSDRLSVSSSMAIVGFCVGTVLQSDVDHRVEPETGERFDGPEYVI